MNISSTSLRLAKEAYLKLDQNENLIKNIVGCQQEVLNRYQPIFHPDHIKDLKDLGFLSFLSFKNNHHWSGLHRQGPKITSDMNRLKKALSILVDETIPIEERLNSVDGMISGLGRAIISAILIVVQPDKYGIWNNKSENAMKAMGIWPHFDRGSSFGERYVKVNAILNELSKQMGIDLWTLDSVWEVISRENSADNDEEADEEESATDFDEIQKFSLERHLHEFLRDNWSKTSLGKEWQIYQEPGNDEAGYEYPTGVGRIDLLTRHRKQAKWMVIELKRDQTCDKTVGQVLRYIGWVKKNLATRDEKVTGLIIANKADDDIKYALSAIQDVDLKLYDVQFTLKDSEQIE